MSVLPEPTNGSRTSPPSRLLCRIARPTSAGGTGRFAHASATFTGVVYHHQVSLVNAVSYGEHEATLDGQLSW